MTMNSGLARSDEGFVLCVQGIDMLIQFAQMLVGSRESFVVLGFEIPEEDAFQAS